MFKEEYYNKIEKRWVENDAICDDGDGSLTITWFNPDSSIPSWEWASVDYDKVLEILDGWEITEENADDFCSMVSSESPQWWEDFDPEDERDLSHGWEKADFIGSGWNEAQYLIAWANKCKEAWG